MKSIRWTSVALCAAACVNPQSRIAKHQAEFDAFPASTQQKIRLGQADVGFTPQQTEMALGAPDRRYNRKTADAVQDVWVYGTGSGSARTGFSLGIGSMFPGPFGAGVGVATGTDSIDDRDVRARVIFQSGLVLSVESRQR
jgi:hypothetical protein